MYKNEVIDLSPNELYIIPQGVFFPKYLPDIKKFYGNKYDLKISYLGDIYVKVNYLHQNTSRCIADASFYSSEITDATLPLDLSSLGDGSLEVSVIAKSDAQIFRFSKPAIFSANAIEPSIVLYDFSFPSTNLCNEESLYFQFSDKVSHYSYNDRSLTLLGDANVDFLTYFNAFSSAKWIKYTNVKSVSAYLDLVGNVEVRIVGLYKNDRLILDCYTVNASERGVYTFPVSVLFDGMLIGVEISNIPVSVTNNSVLSHTEHPHSDPISYDSDNPDSAPSRKLTFAPAVIYGGGWLTADEQTQDVTLGIVISVFNRESEVAGDVARLTSDITAHPLYHDRISVTVLDNGRNLTADDVGCTKLDINHITEGGYERTVPWNLNSTNTPAYCLFMDDDAACDAGSIYRGLSFLRHVTDNQIALSGALLYEDNKYKQFSNGEWFDGTDHVIKQDLDLREQSNLLEILPLCDHP